jgi:zinc protease
VEYKRIDRKYQPTKGGVVDINTPDKANAFYLTAQMIEAKDSDPEYAGLMVGNYLLGASPLSSRLSNRVRGKDGLSYMVMSTAAAGPLDKAGVFLTVAITNPKNVDKVDAAMTEEVAKFIKEGVSAAELEDGKKAWLAAQKEGRASDAALANELAGGLFVGRTMTYYSDLEKQVEKLQPADVSKAFEKLVDPKKMVVIKAGDLSKKDDKKPEEKKDDKKPEEKK